jgi:hypothetical protein
MGMIPFYIQIVVHIVIHDLFYFQSRKFHFYGNLFLDPTYVRKQSVIALCFVPSKNYDP